MENIFFFKIQIVFLYTIEDYMGLLKLFCSLLPDLSCPLSPAGAYLGRL